MVQVRAFQGDLEKAIYLAGTQPGAVVVGTTTSYLKERVHYTLPAIGCQVELQRLVTRGATKFIFVDGTYLFTAPVAQVAKMSWTGLGAYSILKVAPGANCGILYSASGTADVSISHLYFDGNKANQTAGTYLIDGQGSRWLVKHNQIADGYGGGIRLYDNEHRILHNRVTGMAANGATPEANIYVTNDSFDSWIIGNYLTGGFRQIEAWGRRLKILYNNCLAPNTGTPLSIGIYFERVGNADYKSHSTIAFNNIDGANFDQAIACSARDVWLICNNMKDCILGYEIEEAKSDDPTTTADRNHILGGTITGCGTAIAFSGGANDCSIRDILLKDFTTYGVRVWLSGLGPDPPPSTDSARLRLRGVDFDSEAGTCITVGAGINNLSFKRCNFKGAATVLSDAGTGTTYSYNDGFVTENSGAATGTGAQQLVAHGLAFTPTRQQIALTAGSATALPFHSADPDATNIKVTAALNQPWYWATAGR